MIDANKVVKITLAGKISYADEISLSQAAQIIALIDSWSAAPGAVGSPPTLPGFISPRRASSTSNPREALEASGAKTIPEKIVTFALYVSQEGDKDTFTLEDIRPLFRRAREAAPGNITRDLSAAIKSGWVAESDVKGEFYITDKAARVLETGFEPIRSSGTKARTSSVRKPRKTNGAVPVAFQEIDAIAPTIDGLIDYHKLKTKADRFLWAVYAAKHHGVAAVDNQEIVWLTDFLGDGIPSKDISAYYNRFRQNGYLNRAIQGNKIRITPAGEDHLRSLSLGESE